MRGKWERRKYECNPTLTRKHGEIFLRLSGFPRTHEFKAYPALKSFAALNVYTRIRRYMSAQKALQTIRVLNVMLDRDWEYEVRIDDYEQYDGCCVAEQHQVNRCYYEHGGKHVVRCSCDWSKCMGDSKAGNWDLSAECEFRPEWAKTVYDVDLIDSSSGERIQSMGGVTLMHHDSGSVRDEDEAYVAGVVAGLVRDQLREEQSTKHNAVQTAAHGMEEQTA